MGTAQIFLQLVAWVTRYESNTLILSMSIFAYDRYTRNIRKDKNMSLDLILQLLDSISYLLDFPISGSEKKNNKTKHIHNNPSNRQQRRAQNKRNHQANIMESTQTMKSARLFK